MHKNTITLLEKALVKLGYRHDEITITLSPSKQIAHIKTAGCKFNVLLSERQEQIIQAERGHAMSEYGINLIRNSKVRYVFFYCSTAGIIIEAHRGPHTLVCEYLDEFGSDVWVYCPLNEVVKI